ncbi:BRCA2-interacting transcriptional repressor EMSY-like isoform X2 [Macrosteles quadrilineatus]|uniref:BRCA2-interacting transcriptional repressor EMSY-like isoform X2 n=1 Tax=Macrosteles quadrilineatus TaxID=74068 RepID=UPI0023E182BA|nr:BRCA2-interacting transcriptional repressor EMSY-like isoform X2 [Macrosteles quadrilineatus]
MQTEEEPAFLDFKPACNERPSSPTWMTEEEALGELRRMELDAYHSLVWTFRAQGRLTANKLRLMKEVAAELYIPEYCQKLECGTAMGNGKLNEIAEWVAGPGTDVEWKEECSDWLRYARQSTPSPKNVRIVNAIAAAYHAAQREMEEAGEPDGVVKTIKIDSSLFDDNANEEEAIAIEARPPEEILNFDNVAKEEPKDDDESSSLSSASDDYQMKLEEDIKQQDQKADISKEELDASLMPPPPPVIVIPSPTHVTSLPSPPAVITVPPPAVITVPPPTDSVVATAPKPASVQPASPVLSEEEAKARADFLSSLPPLVVVPPPDPSETTGLPSPSASPRSPSMVISPTMSLQIREDPKKRKRSASQLQDSATLPTSAKTVALSSYSKMTRVMVTATSSGQVKVAPIISRAKTATTPMVQKVVIVSNTPTSNTGNTSMMQRSPNVPMGSLSLPIVRGNQPRLQTVTAQNCGTVRPKMVTVPAKSKAKGSNMVNLQLKNPVTLKQDNVTGVDTNLKRLSGPAKILPKPSGSMFVVNTSHGDHKLATAMGGKEGGKQNVVIVQKGGNKRLLTLSDKDLMEKLMSKKCVVIQSSKMVPKNISPKPLAQPSTSQTQPPTSTSQQPPQQQQTPPVISASGNTVVVDLSQEQYRQNLGDTTVRDILQAAGIISQPTTTPPAPVSEPTQVSSREGEWLPVETSKSLSLEEVSLPLGQAESFVTLDEAVEMLEEQQIEEGVPTSESSGFTQVSTEQLFTITSDQLTSGDLAVIADDAEAPVTQIVMEALPSEVLSDLESINQPFMPHRDGAVTIQHSNIDVPANMSLEDYSSQQMEN